MKILVCEDDKFLQNAYKVKLEKAGIETVIVENGELGLKELRTNKYNLVLLDLIMPTMDGFGFLAEYSKDETLKKIPVIVASNLGQDEDIKKAISFGAKEFIIKSDTPLNDIVEKIRKLAIT